MSFSQTIEKFNNSKVKSFAAKAFSSYIFPFVTAAITLVSSIFGLEPLVIWYICLCGAAICLCCKDVSPVICLFVFMHIIVSLQHSPDKRVEWCDPTYMTSPAFLTQAAVAILIFLIAIVYRIVDSIIKHRFKITPIFIGLCAYFTALVLNGLFSTKYYFMDTVYGLGIGAIILFMFVFISGNVVVNEGTYKRIAVVFVAFCMTLALQLLHAYLSLGVVKDGVIIRGLIQFGWGTYNQFGMVITMCIPAWFFLAAKCKKGVLFLLGVPFNLAVVVLGMSRQAILMAGVLAVICCVWYLIIAPKKYKIYGGSFMLVAVVIALIVLLVKREEFANIFKDLAASFTTGSGRTGIWQDGLKKFLHNPVFGNGFYDISATWHETPGYIGAGYGFTEAVPFMCHNTFIQLLFACGLVGFVAYIVHRVQTVISLFKNPDAGRFFLMFTICGILLTSLLDNHVFYPLPLFIYSPLLAVFAVSEKRQEAECVDNKEVKEEIEVNSAVEDVPQEDCTVNAE
ncbi:MAG: O-antigen ligase family protein [Candidatus Coproplasma sp.]